jgi:hypothetical protein
MEPGETMRNLGCLVVAILLLPIFLIIIGPLLVLAAVRGRQSVGSIMLNSSQYGPAGRIGALMLGLGLWLLIWGGLVWVIINGLLPGSTTIVAVGTPTLAPPLAVQQPASSDDSASQPDNASTPTPTDNPLPTNTPTVLVIIDPTSTPAFDATVPVTNALATDTPDAPSATDTTMLTNTETLTDTIALTSTIVTTDTEVFEGTLEPTVIFIATPAEDGSQPNIETTAVPTVVISPADSQAVLRTVEDGNALLREAISLANEENLAGLESVWQGRALEKAEAFAIDLYDRYAKPFDVEFKFLSVPTIKRSTPEEITVVSQEIWNYGGQTVIIQEAFEFTYVLSRGDDGWVITYYSYLNVPIPETMAVTSTPPPAPTLTSQ